MNKLPITNVEENEMNKPPITNVETLELAPRPDAILVDGELIELAPGTLRRRYAVAVLKLRVLCWILRLVS